MQNQYSPPQGCFVCELLPHHVPGGDDGDHHHRECNDGDDDEFNFDDLQEGLNPFVSEELVEFVGFVQVDPLLSNRFHLIIIMIIMVTMTKCLSLPLLVGWFVQKWPLLWEWGPADQSDNGDDNGDDDVVDDDEDDDGNLVDKPEGVVCDRNTVESVFTCLLQLLLNHHFSHDDVDDSDGDEDEVE